MTKYGKLIFLDIDGVLNSGRSFTALEGRTFDLKKVREIQKREKISFDSACTRAFLDEIAVKLVNRLIEMSDAQIVISSSHRHYFHVTEEDPLFKIKTRVGFNLKGLARYIHELGVIGDVVGWTPDLPDPAIRGDEIKSWLEQNGAAKKYVILDDDADFLPEQLPFFVQTHELNGFTLENYIQACRVLECNDSVIESYRRIRE